MEYTERVYTANEGECISLCARVTSPEASMSFNLTAWTTDGTAGVHGYIPLLKQLPPYKYMIFLVMYVMGSMCSSNIKAELQRLVAKKI